MDVCIDDEDSLTTRFERRKEMALDLAVIRFPRISNFTDFSVFETIEGVSLRYVNSVEELHHPDMILLPGSKNTMGDLKWMRQNGLEAAILKRQEESAGGGVCREYERPHLFSAGRRVRRAGDDRLIPFDFIYSLYLLLRRFP